MGRHTLTLDEDVENLLDEEQKETGRSFKAVVNDLLREVRQRRLGDRKRRPSRRYAVEPLSVGRVRHEVVSVTEALELAEGDAFR
ncbi:MAG: hypothetical protein QNK03_22110 [Myxococcota bacterium]|nr:hypothetical protein [Myxococcota bacterium]